MRRLKKKKRSLGNEEEQVEGSEMGKRQQPLLRHRLGLGRGSKPTGCGSAMDWKSIRKILKASIREPVSGFTGMALDADGRWMGWEQGRTSGDHLELRGHPGKTRVEA